MNKITICDQKYAHKSLYGMMDGIIKLRCIHLKQYDILYLSKIMETFADRNNISISMDIKDRIYHIFEFVSTQTTV